MDAGPRLERVAVAACTAHAWVRGVVEVPRPRRLSDLLNQPAAQFLPLLDGELLPNGATEWPRARARLYLHKAEILFLHPTGAAGDSMARPDLRVAKVAVPVAIHLGEYRVCGSLHLPDRVPWEEYLSVVRERFLAVTNATIDQAMTADVVAEAAFVAVNRQRVSVFYEV